MRHGSQGETVENNARIDRCNPNAVYARAKVLAFDECAHKAVLHSRRPARTVLVA
jgi:hypothetical protein